MTVRWPIRNYGHSDRRFHHENPGYQRRLAERQKYWQKHRDRGNDWRLLKEQF